MKWFLVAFCIIWVNCLDLEDNEDQLGDGIPELYDGDMLLTPEQKRILSLDGKDFWRVAYGHLVQRWPHNTVIYVFGAGSKHGLTKDEKNKVRAAMDYIESKTCVKYRPRQGQKDEDHVMIRRGSPGCWTNVGRGRYARLNLGEEKCFKHGAIVHELLHILGFAHTHQAPNRDDYIDINWGNVNKSAKNAFKKLPSEHWTMLGLPYDYDSVMHFSRKALSKNGEDTIVPQKKGVNIGFRQELSELDIKRINKYYNCPNV
ncbi:hypothetical protein DMENIID0001_171330 [Sergentomyia squamirostris]